MDPIRNTFWVHTDHTIYELVIDNESRDVWRLFLAKNQFESALDYARTPQARTVVLEAQAEFYFNKGRFLLAANYFAQAETAFETVVLKFMDVKPALLDQLAAQSPQMSPATASSNASAILLQSDSAQYAALRGAVQDALKSYLLLKFGQLGAADATQRTLLATWLLELYLKRLNSYDDAQATARAFLRDEFVKWVTMDAVRLALDVKTAYRLFSSHGCMEEMVSYASAMEDWDRVIAHHVQQQAYTKAIEAMQRQVGE